MKLWLDDERDPKTDQAATAFWRDAHWVKTPEEAIEILCTGQVTALSLDNDLALPNDEHGQPQEGYKVAYWLEGHVYFNQDFEPPAVLNLHSGNIAVRTKVEAAFRNIRRMRGSEG